MTYKITASLLNSWNYLWEANEEWQEKAYTDFVNTLRGIRTPRTDAMQRGIDFEQIAIDGGVPEISQIIKDGVYQLYAEKYIIVDGMKFKLLGYLDVLKAGVIYDIKRNTRYEYGKFENSYQHWMYMTLIPEAYEFRYLVGSGYSKNPYDASVNIHTTEVYKNDGYAEDRIITAIRQFIAWLKTQNLYELYLENFKVEERQK